jgi:hypothetical protein
MDDEKMEDSKLFLAETDEEFARKSAYVKMAPFYAKIIKAKHFLDSHGTVAERESKAYDSKEFREYIRKLDEATVDADVLEAKRESAKREVDIWRTLSANRRNG